MSSEAPSGRPSEAATGLETFDDLADLFLGDELAPTPRASGDQSVHVSSLIVGHLPVIAAPWISQHARDLARTMVGPVAVLSRSGDRTTLDLYNAPPLSEQHTIEGAIDQAVSARVRRWLIRTDAVSELSAYDLDRVDSVTMLTGADDAAVVSVYRAIKGLVADTSELDERPMVLNLAVMGSERTKARSAAEKIRKASVEPRSLRHPRTHPAPARSHRDASTRIQRPAPAGWPRIRSDRSQACAGPSAERTHSEQSRAVRIDASRGGSHLYRNR